MGQRADEVGRRPEDVSPVDRDVTVERNVMITSDPGAPAGAPAPAGAEAQASPEEIRADIERTRADMSETIDAIQERLSPQNLAEQAKETVYDATVGRAQQTATGAKSSMLDTIKRNPVPAAIAGLSLAYLWMNRSSSSSGARTYYQYEPRYQTYDQARYQTYDQPYATTGYAQGRGEQTGSQARETAQQYGRQTQEQARQYADQAQQQAGQATDWLQQTLQENPLALGAAAVVLGAAVGLAVPETRKEHELMGETRDSVLEQAKSKAQDTMQRAEHVAEEAQSAAKQEAQNQGLSS